MDCREKRSVIIEELENIFKGKAMLSRRDVAHYLNITPITLSKLEKKNLAPKHIRIGNIIRYPLSSFADYLIKNEQ